MAGARFDILFAGELIGDADPEKVRRRLQQLFGLSEEAAERLFGGHTVIVKRGVDTATASRYRKIFRDAKALIEIRPVEAPPQPHTTSTSEPLPEPILDSVMGPSDAVPSEQAGARPDDLPPSRGAGDLAPLAQRYADGPQEIDVSHLSLVPGDDWTLEDCQPRLPPVELPDISHLAIVATEPDTGEEHED